MIIIQLFFFFFMAQNVAAFLPPISLQSRVLSSLRFCITRARWRFSQLGESITSESAPSSTSLDDKDQNIYEGLVNSNFWFAKPALVIESPEKVIPFQQNLDDDEGPLPYGSYRNYQPKNSRDSSFKKQYCIVSLSLDLMNESESNGSNLDWDKAVSHMQQFVDAGFTTFSIPKPIPSKSTSPSSKVSISPVATQTTLEANLYNKFIRDTPQSLLDEISLATRIRVPSNDFTSPYPDYVPNLVRFEVMESIQRMYKDTPRRTIGCGNPSLDVVQVEYNKDNSPYHADVVHALMELQREGWVRSIVGSEFPVEMMHKIEQDCGTSLDGNQVRANLIDPNEYLKHLKSMEATKTSTSSIHILSPLAGGILSNDMVQWPHNWRNYQGVPQWHRTQSSSLPWHYRHSILGSWKKSLTREKEQMYLMTTRAALKPYHHGKVSTWVKFEQIVLTTLQKIAKKHRVSVSSIAIRWMLQSGPLSSLVVGTSLNAKHGDDRHFRRPSELRNAMKFMLDDEDMEELWDVSGKLGIVTLNELQEEYHEFSNRKLWL